jgi:AcrR family transcriptional regulator
VTSTSSNRTGAAARAVMSGTTSSAWTATAGSAIPAVADGRAAQALRSHASIIGGGVAGRRFGPLDAAASAHNRTVVRISNNRSKNGRQRGAAAGRRADILHAASRVFRTMGFAAAGMRDIAVAADLSPANLYHYFSGKDEILYACQHLTLDRLQAAAAAAARARGPVAGRLRALATDHVLCVIDQIQGSAVHFEPTPPSRLRAAVVARRDGTSVLSGAGLGASGAESRRRSGGGDPRLPKRASTGPSVVSSRRCAAGRSDCSMLADYAVRGLRTAVQKTRIGSPSTASRDVAFEPYKTLLEVLREDLNLCGTRTGAARRVRRVRRAAGQPSCVVPGWASSVAAGRWTVEGLATEGRSTRSRRLADLGALGAAVHAHCHRQGAARSNAASSRDQIREALSEPLPCTGCNRSSAVEAAVLGHERHRQGPPSALTSVTGQTRFADDVVLPRMRTRVCPLQSHARIKTIDVARPAMTGVHLVLTGSDLPIPYGILPVGQTSTPSLDRVRFVGDPVARRCATS